MMTTCFVLWTTNYKQLAHATIYLSRMNCHGCWSRVNKPLLGGLAVLFIVDVLWVGSAGLSEVSSRYVTEMKPLLSGTIIANAPHAFHHRYGFTHIHSTRTHIHSTRTHIHTDWCSYTHARTHYYTLIGAHCSCTGTYMHAPSFPHDCKDVIYWLKRG